MKKTTTIATTVLAAAIMLVATIVPHHHHSSMICSMVERCAIDGSLNDEHTAHKCDRHSSNGDDCTFSATVHKAVRHIAATVAALPAQPCGIPRRPAFFTTLLPAPERQRATSVAASRQQLRAPPIAL